MSREGSDTLNTSFNANFGNDSLDLTEVDEDQGPFGVVYEEDEDENEMERSRSHGNGEITLSSDEEGEHEEGDKDDEEITLVTVRPKCKSMLARPRADQDPAIFTPNEESRANPPEVEKIVASDELGIKSTERTGYVKEYIDADDGLGILFSMECGLVVFHLDTAWVDGRPADRSAVHGEMQPGTNVTFLDCVHEGPEYKVVSEERFLRQAAALWTGPRPQMLLRAVNKEEHLAAMERHRKDFLVHVRGESFLHANLVRQKGRITGYLTEDVGLVEFRFTPKGDLHLAFFCPKDAYVYRKQAHKFGVPVWQSVPAGLNVFFDARRMVPPYRGVGYQVIALFAGSWPSVPHPTLLPGGPGSVCTTYDLDESASRQTFYYLNLKLPEIQDEDWEEFRIQSDRHGTRLMEYGDVIESREDFFRWQSRFAPVKIQQRQRSGGSFQRRQQKTNYHEFKRQPPKAPIFTKRIKIENDEPVQVKIEQRNDGELSYRVKSEPNY